ncbi:alpha/beta fold hydrolase [Paenisporosarcina sp. TG20]|uniref:alpha/beta fold hydrolase n=1 Tax=Paenisporosarcina sp. TG20 TaxID=1211706 RepID=UPI000474E718|nr:alpha/beta hydrolase [Paenisporosarcina sp. TG20]
MKRYYIKDNDLDVHITEWGDKRHPVIFCLHGLGSTSLSFIEIAEKLKEDYRIVSLDAPGHGKTPPFLDAEKYEYPYLALWLHRILDILEINRFYFLSHSWGSFVSLYYLSIFPNRVIGTILIDGGYQTKWRGGKSMEQEIAYYEKDFEEYVFNNWVEFLTTEKRVYSRWSPLLEVAVKDLGIQLNNKVIWHARGTTAKHIIQAMHKHETEDIYQQLPPHIQLLRATLPMQMDDERTIASDIFRQKANGHVQLIEDTTHMLHWDKPDVVVNEIRKNWNLSLSV